VIEKVLFTWSGGKDSAMALYELEMSEGCEIAALLTTVTQDYDRISMHGVRRSLLQQQAESLRLPLEIMRISKDAANEEYDVRMANTLVRYREQGVSRVVFGDIFLEDVRRYRQDNLERVGMTGLFPLWGRDTRVLAQEFIDLGFKAVLTCVDSEFLDGKFAGRVYDRDFLSELPEGVDPCGENGEFHSFVYDGPIFRETVLHRKGKVVLRDNRFYYCDLMPVRSRKLQEGALSNLRR
jgi:uncharacterized protein (TIGR00290 family)